MFGEVLHSVLKIQFTQTWGKRMGCNSQVGKLLQALIRYHYSFGYLSCQYSFWLFGFLWKLFPLRRSMVCVCKLIEKKSKKRKQGRDRMVPKTVVHFFFAGGSFLILNQGFSLSFYTCCLVLSFLASRGEVCFFYYSHLRLSIYLKRRILAYSDHQKSPSADGRK